MDYNWDDEKTRRIKQEIIESVTLNMTNEINKQNSAFTKMVHEHALGVQRVYDELQKLVDRIVKLETYEGEEEQEPELDRCPFCDSHAELEERMNGEYCVSCCGCNAKTDNYGDKETAITAWNDRP